MTTNRILQLGLVGLLVGMLFAGWARGIAAGEEMTSCVGGQVYVSRHSLGPQPPADSEEQDAICERVAWLQKYPPLLQGRVLVGLYGTAGGPGLGILGTRNPTKTVALVEEQAAAYQALLTGTQVVPLFHMVTVIADAKPGKDGNYSHRVSSTTLQAWIDVAQSHGVWCVLDVQTGHSPLTVELAYVEPFLRQPHVHLAIDPEFMMSDTTWVPGQHIGFMDGETLNMAQAWLNEVALQSGERKLLIIHQFDDRMFGDKSRIRRYPLVELIWDADGFGGPSPKIDDYLQYAAEPGFEYGGFKLFYNYDRPLMTPAQVLRLRPQPVFVIYQ